MTKRKHRQPKYSTIPQRLTFEEWASLGFHEANRFRRKRTTEPHSLTPGTNHNEDSSVHSSSQDEGGQQQNVKKRRLDPNLSDLSNSDSDAEISIITTASHIKQEISIRSKSSHNSRGIPATIKVHIQNDHKDATVFRDDHDFAMVPLDDEALVHDAKKVVLTAAATRDAQPEHTKVPPVTMGRGSAARQEQEENDDGLGAGAYHALCAKSKRSGIQDSAAGNKHNETYKNGRKALFIISGKGENSCLSLVAGILPKCQSGKELPPVGLVHEVSPCSMQPGNWTAQVIQRGMCLVLRHESVGHPQELQQQQHQPLPSKSSSEWELRVFDFSGSHREVKMVAQGIAQQKDIQDVEMASVTLVSAAGSLVSDENVEQTANLSKVVLSPLHNKAHANKENHLHSFQFNNEVFGPLAGVTFVLFPLPEPQITMRLAVDKKTKTVVAADVLLQRMAFDFDKKETQELHSPHASYQHLGKRVREESVEKSNMVRLPTAHPQNHLRRSGRNDVVPSAVPPHPKQRIQQECRQQESEVVPPETRLEKKKHPNTSAQHIEVDSLASQKSRPVEKLQNNRFLIQIDDSGSCAPIHTAPARKIAAARTIDFGHDGPPLPCRASNNIASKKSAQKMDPLAETHSLAQNPEDHSLKGSPETKEAHALALESIPKAQAEETKTPKANHPNPFGSLIGGPNHAPQQPLRGGTAEVLLVDMKVDAKEMDPHKPDLGTRLRKNINGRGESHLHTNLANSAASTGEANNEQDVEGIPQPDLSALATVCYEPVGDGENLDGPVPAGTATETERGSCFLFFQQFFGAHDEEEVVYYEPTEVGNQEHDTNDGSMVLAEAIHAGCSEEPSAETDFGPMWIDWLKSVLVLVLIFALLYRLNSKLEDPWHLITAETVVIEPTPPSGSDHFWSILGYWGTSVKLS